MANNRMWLVHKTSGKKALLAKYFPSSGWRHYADMEHEIEMLLYMGEDVDNGPMYGDTEFVIEFDEIE